MGIPAERTFRVCGLAVVALAPMIGLFPADHAFGQPARGAVPSVIRSVRTETGKDGLTTVVIEGSAALPEPSSGVAATPPPRIYLDFTDVLPDLNLQPIAPTPAVKAVRVAEHSATPLVTRVVLNLVKSSPYRVDSSARSQGRIAVVLGGPPSEGAKATPPAVDTGSASSHKPAARSQEPAAGSQQPAVKSQPTTPPLNPGSQSAGQSPAARGRSDAAENQYGVRISSALVRLYALRPLLEAIDRRADSIPGDLNAAAAEFDSIGKLLGGIKPPSTREGTHALLLRTCTLGARAVRMREEASATKDPAKGWDAASAAAGAMMIFDKANGDLAK